MAVCAFVRSLLRCPVLPVDTDQDSLHECMDTAIRNGTGELKTDLLRLYDAAWSHATDEERDYLPLIYTRINQGSLAELIRDRFSEEGEILPILSDMAMCLKMNTPYEPAPSGIRH